MENLDIDFESVVVPARFSNWSNRKIFNKLPAKLFYSINKGNRAKSILGCSDFLEVQKTQFKRKITKLYLCGDRFCFNCNFLKSRKQFATYHRVFREMSVKEENISFIFLTLTVENPHYEDLQSTYKTMSKALVSLLMSVRKKRGRFKHILGGIRAFEITVQKSDKSYLHPHYHILLVVDNNYFEDIITSKEWSEIWNKYLEKHEHYQKIKPIVNVKKVYSKDFNEFTENPKDIQIAKAVAETTKYSMKITDLKAYIENPQAFKSLVDTFYKLRSWSDFGIVKEYRQELKLKTADELTEDELIRNNLDVTEDGKHELFERWKYEYGNYELESIINH